MLLLLLLLVSLLASLPNKLGFDKDLPAGIADTEQTPQAAIAVVELVERLAAVAAPSSAARLVAVAEPVELASLVWSYQWRSAGAFVGLWQGMST